MKPVALIQRMLANSARRGARVLDPFGGSGSTLIACETLGLRHTSWSWTSGTLT
jgi:DNA modification methylase